MNVDVVNSRYSCYTFRRFASKEIDIVWRSVFMWDLIEWYLERWTRAHNLLKDSEDTDADIICDWHELIYLRKKCYEVKSVKYTRDVEMSSR